MISQAKILSSPARILAPKTCFMALQQKFKPGRSFHSESRPKRMKSSREKRSAAVLFFACGPQAANLSSWPGVSEIHLDWRFLLTENFSFRITATMIAEAALFGAHLICSGRFSPTSGTAGRIFVEVNRSPVLDSNHRVKRVQD